MSFSVLEPELCAVSVNNCGQVIITVKLTVLIPFFYPVSTDERFRPKKGDVKKVAYFSSIAKFLRE